MPIRPIDVRRKEFKNSFRGYDANQVDDFLDAVADEFERSYTENSRMREEISSLRDRLQQFEELEGSIRAALVHAEQAANDLRRTATQEAEDVRLSANREAEFTIREAKARSHQMLADSSARVERIQQSYEAMQEAKRNFTNDFRHLLKTYIDVMDNVEVVSAKEIEASLRSRLDTESIAVAREAAAHDEGAQRTEESDVEQEEAELAELQQEVAGIEEERPEEERPEEERPEEERPFVADDSGVTQRLEPEPTTEAPAYDEPEPERPEAEGPAYDEPDVAEPEMEPSSVEGREAQGSLAEEPAAADEVDREEASLAEEGRSQEFFDREEGTSEQDRSDSRIFRASRFLRRRE
jgi:cell division initiation protein